MKVPFSAAASEDYIGDEEYGFFVNVAEVHPKQWFYTLTKQIQGTPVIEAADEGPFPDFVDAMSAATQRAERYLQ